MSDPSVFVTGTGDPVGAEVTAALDGSGATVRTASGDATGRHGRDPAGVAVDFERPGTWRGAFDGVDRLFLVRPPGVGAGRVREAVDAAARAGVERIVFRSAFGAGRLPGHPDRRVERHLRSTGATATVVRPGVLMQALAREHAPPIRERDEVFVPAGRGRANLVDARDVAAVAVAALLEDGHGGRTYTVTGAEAVDYDRVARILSEELGRRIRYADPSPLAFARELSARGVPRRAVAASVGVHAATRLGLADAVTTDFGRVCKRPPTRLRAFAADHRGAWSATDRGADRFRDS